MYLLKRLSPALTARINRVIQARMERELLRHADAAP